MSDISNHPNPDEVVTLALTGTDEQVGPACMNVPVPPTIATDEAFREAYVQGYRHALSDVRSRLKREL